jgi:hypothetical protein
MTQETDLGDIERSNSTEALTDLLTEYCDTNNLPRMSADELLLVLGAQWEWLQAFVARWDVVQDEEDLQSAIRARGVE